MDARRTTSRDLAGDGPARGDGARDDSAGGDKPARLAVWPGVLVAVVALVGVHQVAAASVAGPRGHRAAALAVRVATPGNAVVLAQVSGLTWAVAVLAVLLLLGRQVRSIRPRVAPAELVPLAGQAWAALLPRRKTSISYHTGGLLGP
jgi:hypothetical protein